MYLHLWNSEGAIRLLFIYLSINVCCDCDVFIKRILDCGKEGELEGKYSLFVAFNNYNKLNTAACLFPNWTEI